MLSEAPLLTIAVPTYKRSSSLARLLKSLVPQLADQPRVQLLISDNASPDDTADILDQYRGAGLVFRSMRNETNIGADGNIAQCFLEAAGKYVWIVGDDDVLGAHAVAAIVDLLSQDEYDLVYLRGKELIHDDEPPVIPSKPHIEVIEDARIFTIKTHVTLTFITGNIINKQRVDSLPHRPFSLLKGTSLIQLSWMYTALGHFRKGAYILDPMIGVGSDDRGGYGFYTVFGANLKQITETWLSDPALVRIILHSALQNFLPPYVLRSRANEKSFIEDQYEAKLATLYAHTFRYFLFLYPILKLPLPFAKIWLNMCRIINRIDDAIGHPLLR